MLHNISCFFKLLSRLLIISTVFSLLLSEAVFAAETPQVIQLENDLVQVDIVSPSDDVSHNQLEQFDVSKEGMVINNGSSPSFTQRLGNIFRANTQLDKPAKVILIEVTGDQSSELKGPVTVAGSVEQVKLILVNSNGITCNDCGFAGANQVELRTDKIDRVIDGDVAYNSIKDSKIYIDQNGIAVDDGSLLLNSGKIITEGKILVKDELRVIAHHSPGITSSDTSAISINTVSPISAKNIYLSTFSNSATIDIATPKRFLSHGDGELQAAITSTGSIYINTPGDVNIAGSLYSATDLKIAGRNVSIFKPQLIVNQQDDSSSIEANMPQIESRKSFDLQGDLYLEDGVILKSNGKFLKLTGKVTGSGELESNAKVSVISPENISLNSVSASKGITLVATNEVFVSTIDANKEGDAEIFGKKIELNNINNVENLILHGNNIAGDFKSNNVKKIALVEHKGKVDSTSTMDFNITSPLTIDGDFSFVGRNFINRSNFTANNVRLELSGDFINEGDGNIQVAGKWTSISKGFVNNKNIEIEGDLKVESETFVNDKGGSIIAASLNVYLTGKRADGYSLVQQSDSVLHAKKDGMKLTAPVGGLYFGYKKIGTGAGANGLGFRLEGSKLLSDSGDILIFAAGNVIFDGAQTAGKVIVRSKNTVLANQVKDKYQDGTEEKDCWEEHWCKAFGLFGSCVGGNGYATHCTTVPKYVEVVLNPNFLGQEFYSDQQNLIFEQQASNTENIDIQSIEEVKYKHGELLVNSGIEENTVESIQYTDMLVNY